MSVSLAESQRALSSRRTEVLLARGSEVVVAIVVEDITVLRLPTEAVVPLEEVDELGLVTFSPVVEGGVIEVLNQCVKWRFNP